MNPAPHGNRKSQPRQRFVPLLCRILPQSVLLLIGVAFIVPRLSAATNLLRNPGIEDLASADHEIAPGWTASGDSETTPVVEAKEARLGRHCLAIPANSSIEQKVENLKSGAYLARCWVKSSSAQSVAFLLQNSARRWAAYNYAEIKVPKGEWTLLEVYCALDQDGELTLTLGGMSQEFRAYHGAGATMRSSILADDFELVRCDLKTSPGLTLWDANPASITNLDWSAKDKWSTAPGSGHAFAGVPVFQIRHLAGALRKEDGGLVVYAAPGQALRQRGIIVPQPPFKAATCVSIQQGDRAGLRVTSESGSQSYIAWLLPTGLIRIEADHVASFQIQESRLRYGLLPSFVGTDILYSPAKISGIKHANIPSTQWYVGLVDGNDSMLVAVWDSPAQTISMELVGEAKNRIIDGLTVDTTSGGFALSFVEHPALWHAEALQEDWLGEYTPIGWKAPFQARWMGQFFASPGARPSFHDPYMDYSFPVANMKTRMWGVWFEDWNHYPFYFDGAQTMLHFEKTFTPKGDALFYFLEPAAADLYSPCEIVEQALGAQNAAALFDFDANKIRKLNYSTPDEFRYDRPVCATTTRLSHIKQTEKPTVGVNLATHLYEFIRGIRGRVDQYVEFFRQMKDSLAREKNAHPEMGPFISPLEALVAEAQSKPREVYATPLPAVQAKAEAMKKLLLEGQGDGFDCGNLDVRGPAGAQDDLCRRYNRLVMRLAQTAAANCLDSPQKAVLAKNIWDQSRLILREPTRWESRRTLYFFEP